MPFLWLASETWEIGGKERAQTLNGTGVFSYIYPLNYTQMLVKIYDTLSISIPGPSSLGAKWFRNRVSIHHPLGFKDGTLTGR